MRWEGATVAVTGASRGIGRAVAQRASARGARVGLIARDADDLELVRRSLDGRAVAAPADVADRAQVESVLRDVEAALGPIDILVANAGIGAYGPFADLDVVDVERLLQVNVLGTVYPIKAVLPGMIERRRGHIAIVASVAGRFGSPFEAAYAATKFAQVGLGEALSVELSAHNVGVSVVNPGVVDTSFFEARGHPYVREFPKLISPEQVADALIGAVERERLETFVPRWFAAAVAIRHLAPRLYAWGTRRSFGAELAPRP
jgi:short-subunit dehydrogenase